MKSLICIDTNIVIRFLQADHPELSAKSREIILGAESGKYRIYFDEIMIAETIWVLTSFYKQDKKEICNLLLKLVSKNWLVNPRKNLILRSLKLCAFANLSYIDSWIAEVSTANKIKLETFDKDLKKQT
mgnify:CR=1 FL=1